MEKKFKTKSEYYKYLIETENYLIEEYENREKKENLSETENLDLKRLKELIMGIRKLNEEQYLKYKNNDEPYYEPYTYENYKEIFANEHIQNLDYRAICEIDSVINDEDKKPAQKVNNIKNLLKAYKKIDKFKSSNKSGESNK